MNRRFIRTLALAACMMMLALALCAGTAAAEGAAPGFLGKQFPDFTVTDTDGNTFTLSEVLKDHEAALINLWASWCGPCQREFPALNEAYGKYGDKVAFIALSTEPRDTAEVISSYRAALGIDFPMGSDEDRKLYQYTSLTTIPVTVVVDRFGNAVFCHDYAFSSAGEVKRVLAAFLGDSYTESKVLNEIPRDAATKAFPVSAARSLRPEDGSIRKIRLTLEGYEGFLEAYVVPDDSLRMRIEIAADDDVASMTYVDLGKPSSADVTDLLDPESGVYVYDQPMPGASDEYPYTRVALYDRSVDEDAKGIDLFLIRGEEAIERLADDMEKEMGVRPAWTWAEEEEAKSGDAPQAYVVHVVDQDNNPVPEVMVNFCTDTACVPNESDENGTVTYTGEPAVYHVQIVDAPEGYSWDEDYEMYTSAEYGEWVLRVKKD